MTRRVVRAALVLCVLCAASRAVPVFSEPLAPPLRFDFESGPHDWRAGKADVPLAAAPGRPGRSLALEADFPGETVISLERRLDLSSAKSLQFDVFFEHKNAATRLREGLQVTLYLKDAELHWYQSTYLLRLPAGRWARYRVNLSGASTDWAPMGHFRPWDGRVRRDLRELGIKFFSRDRFQARLFVDNLVISTEEPRPRPPLQLINFRTNTETVPRCGLFEIVFELSREYENPFDPEQIDILATFIAPSGEVTVVPGFFYQGYVRKFERNEETLLPVGRSEWRVRFAPRQAGTHTWFVAVNDGEHVQTDRRTFTCVESDNPGFVRVCRQDRNYFEFDGGGFFYPIGHNIPAAYNVKGASLMGVTILPKRGTFAFDRFLDGMHAGGENYARIWLASWSFGLEWTHKYDRHYHGLGRYNLENAWRLDYVLNKARRYGIYTQLALTTFGHYRVRGSLGEGDWHYSPYNSANGGFLDRPTQFWTNGRAQKYYHRMLRYIMARWGYDTHIMSWEVSNEIDLVSGYKSLLPQIVQWHRDCVRTIRRYDQGRHLITTNFANCSRDPAILQLEEIDYSSTNWYTMDIVDKMRQIYHMKAAFRKPAIMVECGADFRGSTAPVTERYITVCLWSSYMMPLGGAGMQWWWGFIDERDLYRLFRPLALFAKGEERRNQGFAMHAAKILDGKTGAAVGNIRAECLRNSTRAFLWVCDNALFDKNYQAPSELHQDLALSVPGMRDGDYEAEFWDTLTGEVRGRRPVTSKDGNLRFPLPPFHSNMAVKVKAREAETAPAAAK